ncbi:MAG: hypothetical protein A3J07_03995 [Candidatus Doudnabacteria bacterium RIFCSPLOWO2_02_FULL_49_13]|uniref:Uncharacterized protein n=1 Tax=Candidatus Doudnabacteria bacterium RIFCSPHIGHO2_12_FULL_48_16 TaxID=1817838 RepID=A0A1F5PJF5_9BACT|nr:MAG: hypothetical protein A3B77_02805 [Candidatus Doudnabacteria bacterium RIFCSPHIGHO2_02_FULL_49_24]OGE90078.1 MAG: hypothetical protein A3E29_03140 [Candidatus Doudnabacteria bacterium RIFCSPHIGHO2_12_FULL_48_16]OGE90446.1 MAG: hypothetical protein A2760_00780 [Candidatus Doudnabacteria bacterium RIFCSPHIGHO2_01_FULL_50_67]OGE96502.1 MAG: hypothetical protein A2990_04525 [Candidatus Doudnabacteria bacterium RIFCSPLOWO2_01_FULL_49_40]OGF03221.1 MAG: hypothetical protein A3J07_03995 [Candid
MNLEKTETSTDDNAEPEKPLYYPFIISQLKEAAEHLEDLINHAEMATLDESLFKVRIWDIMMHLNQGFNLRYPAGQNLKSDKDPTKLPPELADLA